MPCFILPTQVHGMLWTICSKFAPFQALRRHQSTRWSLVNLALAASPSFSPPSAALEPPPLPTLGTQDSNRTPVMRSRGMYGSGGFSKGGTPCSAHSTPRTSLGVAGGPCSEAGDTSDVVRSDVAAQPDKDSRMRERLQVLNTFKVRASSCLAGQWFAW